jgi:hypothetical protein
MRRSRIRSTAWFDESHVPSNPLKAGRLWKIGIQEFDKIRIEMTVMNSDVDAIRMKGLKSKHVSKVREA